MPQEQAPPGGEYTAKKELLPPGTFLGKEGKPVQLVRPLEAGTYAKVFLAHYADDPDVQVAVKIAHYGEGLEQFNLLPQEREQLKGGGAVETDDEIAKEAYILQTLEDFGSQHTPKVHHYQQGSNPDNPSYITMDLAKGTFWASGEIAPSFITKMNRQSALVMMRQLVETVKIGHQAGYDFFDNKGIEPQIFWDEEGQNMMLIDWGHSKTASVPSFKRLALEVCQINKWFWQEELQPTKQALEKLMDKATSLPPPNNISIRRENNKVVITNKSRDSMKGEQIFSFIERILAQEPLETLLTDIEKLPDGERIELGEETPFDLRVLANPDESFSSLAERELSYQFLKPVLNLPDSYLTSGGDYIKSSDKIDIVIRWPGRNRYVSDDYRVYQKNMLDQLATAYPNVAEMQQATKLILNLLEYLQDEAGKPISGPILDNFSDEEIHHLFNDIMVLSLRPDIATTGNRNRLKENLGKLGQLLDLSALDNIEEIQKLTEAVTPPPAESVPEFTLETLMGKIKSHPQRDRLSVLAALVKTQATVVPSPAEPPPEPTAPPETSALPASRLDEEGDSRDIANEPMPQLGERMLRSIQEMPAKFPGDEPDGGFWNRVDLLRQAGVSYGDPASQLTYDPNHEARYYVRKIYDASGAEVGTWTKKAFMNKRLSGLPSSNQEDWKFTYFSETVTIGGDETTVVVYLDDNFKPYRIEREIKKASQPPKIDTLQGPFESVERPTAPPPAEAPAPTEQQRENLMAVERYIGERVPQIFAENPNMTDEQAREQALQELQKMPNPS